MNKALFYRLVIFLFLLGVTAPLTAQVTIGVGNVPALGALLQLKEKEVTDDGVNSNKGLNMPRVYLSSETNLYPMFLSDPDNPASAPTASYSAVNKPSQDKQHTGLMVYNLNETAPFSRAIYVWNGAKWTQADGGATADADNGLSINGTKIQLGGELIKPTTINQKNFDMIYTPGTAALKVTNALNVKQNQVNAGSDLSAAPRIALQVKENAQTDPLLANSSRGFGLPRYQLVSLTCLFDVANAKDSTLATYDTNYKVAHTGMLVYNATTDDSKNIIPGVYVWSGTRWGYIPLFDNPTDGGDGGKEVPPPGPTDPDDDASLRLPNSYIVGKGKTVKFPVIKAFAVWKNYQQIVANVDYTNKFAYAQSRFRVVLLWQDNMGLVTSVNLHPHAELPYLSYISATINPNLEGNALVALQVEDKPGNNTWLTMWAWHLWGTNYSPAKSIPADLVAGLNQVNGKAVYKYTSTGYNITSIFMDRNLGATFGTIERPYGSMGLMYQWGRSVPQLGADGAVGSVTLKTVYDITNETVLTNSKSMNTLSEMLCNPTSFNPDVSALRDNSAWNDLKNLKGVMDPCPEGWRVPGTNAWNGLLVKPFANGLGADWGNQQVGYYPAAGYRRNGDGRPTVVGAQGYYWMSTATTATGANVMTFATSNASPTATTVKEFGGSIRCVQE